MEARSFARADGPYGFLQPLRPGRWPQASTILLHAAPQVGRRAHLLVTFPEPQDEQGLREVVRHWGGVIYMVAMSRLMVRRLARS